MTIYNGIHNLHIYTCKIQAQAIREGAESDAFPILDEYCVEIVNRIGVFAPLLCHYMLLLDREQFQFSPYETYYLGKIGKQAGISFHDTYWAYLHDQHELPRSRQRDTQMQNLYGLISRLLDENDRYLLDYLTDEYRALYGAVSKNILEIIKMGYDADDDSKA